MGLVWGGFTAFPYGINTIAEREAFERSTNRPPETGAFMTDGDTASMKRYGRRLRSVSLTTGFTSINSYLAVTGWNGFGCTTAHAIGVVPISATDCLVFNPLAANNSEPTVAKIKDVKAWIARGAADIPKEYRIVTEGEFNMIPFSGIGTLLKQDGTPATTLAEVWNIIRLLDMKGVPIVPDNVTWKLFGFTLSGPATHPEPCFLAMRNGAVVYIIARNMFVTQS